MNQYYLILLYFFLVHLVDLILLNSIISVSLKLYLCFMLTVFLPFINFFHLQHLQKFLVAAPITFPISFIELAPVWAMISSGKEAESDYR